MNGLPRLDPVEDMQITQPAVANAVRQIQELEKQLADNEVFKVHHRLLLLDVVF